MQLLAASGATGPAPWRAPFGRLLTRAAAPLQDAAATDHVDATLLFAALQPRIEKRSLVVHLTGAGPGAGAAHVAASLASAASRHRWCRTLRVDARQPDDRSPGVDGLLSRHRATGALPDESPGPLRLTGPAEGLPRPGELARLYDALRARFTLVLVDLEPVTAAPDTAILSQAADLTLLVVRAGHSRREAVAGARALLEQGGATALGLVLTGRRSLPAFLDRLL
jgi:Mrp family chromosome partitioning ATPase